MKAASYYLNFERLINRALPKYGHSYEIPFDYGDEDTYGCLLQYGSKSQYITLV